MSVHSFYFTAVSPLCILLNTCDGPKNIKSNNTEGEKSSYMSASSFVGSDAVSSFPGR